MGIAPRVPPGGLLVFDLVALSPTVAKTAHEACFLQLCVELGLRNVSPLLPGHVACVWSQRGE